MSKIKENILACVVALSLSSVLSLAACQNVDKDKVKNEIVSDVKYIATSYCSPEFAPMREDLINKAREKYPQFPSFDICPLLDEHINK